MCMAKPVVKMKASLMIFTEGPATNRPASSTEARKPTEAAARVAAARAAANKNSLPRNQFYILYSLSSLAAVLTLEG